MCRKQHINKKCENPSCDRKACTLRHPKICKFFRENGFCKFGEYCKFKHFEKENLDRYKRENEIILKKLADIDKQLEKLQQKEEEIVKIGIFYERISELKVIIAEKDTKIEYLVLKVDEMEARFQALEKGSGDKISLLEDKIKFY